MTWETELRIPYYLCDYTDHLSLWSLARLFQDAADEHTAHYHIGFQDLQQNGLAWVITRAYYHIQEMPRAQEQVKIETWSRKVDRLCAMRDTRLLCNDQVMAAATAMWIVIDTRTRHVVRMPEQVINFQHNDTMATSRIMLEKLRTKAIISETPTQAFAVEHSTIDHNLHVNNAEYVRWAVNAMKAKHDAQLQNNCAIASLEINYYQETYINEPVNIYLQHTDEPQPNNHLLTIQNPRGTAATVMISCKND